MDMAIAPWTVGGSIPVLDFPVVVTNKIPALKMQIGAVLSIMRAWSLIKDGRGRRTIRYGQ